MNELLQRLKVLNHYLLTQVHVTDVEQAKQLWESTEALIAKHEPKQCSCGATLKHKDEIHLCNL